MKFIQEILYNTSLRIYTILLWIISPFHRKAKLWIEGRKNIFIRLEKDFKDLSDKVIWIHTASVGEFEQARPIIERLKSDYPQYKILLTFFSPSGYELRKNYINVDYVYYLPIDGKKNAEYFLSITNPVLALFVKYEFWHYYIQSCKKRKIPLLSFSTILRPNQQYFKWHGSFYREILKNITYFFVQNKETKNLLRSINIASEIAGDTRCDQVKAIADTNKRNEIVEVFTADTLTLIVGSAWAEDMSLLIPYINANPQYKYIIAPHEINREKIKVEQQLIHLKCANYSLKETVINADILYIDCIGILSQIYKYADIVYIGGAFGSGLHNILEPAVFASPILFGNKYNKFQEAKDLLQLGGAYSISSEEELKNQLDKLFNNPKLRKQVGDNARNYVLKQSGASDVIFDYIKTIL